MRLTGYLLALALLGSSSAWADDDDKIMQYDQEKEACKMMRKIVIAAIEQDSFESLINAESKRIAEEDQVEIELLADLPVKPTFWRCDVMPGNIDIICSIREVSNPEPGQMARLEKKLGKLVSKCTGAKGVGWRDNSTVDARRGFAYPTTENVIAFVRSREFMLEGKPMGKHGLSLSFSIGKLKN